jgi:hypothetical protein
VDIAIYLKLEQKKKDHLEKEQKEKDVKDKLDKDRKEKERILQVIPFSFSIVILQRNREDTK